MTKRSRKLESKSRAKETEPLDRLTWSYTRRIEGIQLAVRNTIDRYGPRLALSDNRIMEDSKLLAKINAAVLKLKEIRPDCGMLKDGYERKLRTYRRLVQAQVRSLGSIEGRISLQKNRAWHMQRQLDWCASQIPDLDTLSEYLKMVYEDSRTEDLQGSFASVPPRVGEEIVEGLALAKSIGFKYAGLSHDVDSTLVEARMLENPSHAFADITEIKSFPSARPDETRQEERIVGRRCTKCGLRAPRWETIQNRP